MQALEVGGLGPELTKPPPPHPRAQESLRSENPPGQPRLGYLQVAGSALERQRDTLESTGRKLQSESSASFSKSRNTTRLCFGPRRTQCPWCPGGRGYIKTGFPYKRLNTGILDLWGEKGAEREGEGTGLDKWQEGGRKKEGEKEKG